MGQYIHKGGFKYQIDFDTENYEKDLIGTVKVSEDFSNEDTYALYELTLQQLTVLRSNLENKKDKFSKEEIDIYISNIHLIQKFLLHLIKHQRYILLNRDSIDQQIKDILG